MENLSLHGPLRPEVMGALRQSSWFRALQRRSAASPGGPAPLEMILDSARLERFGAGETILRAGAPSDCLHVLVRGSAVARLGAPPSVDTTHMAPPEAFGEVGLLLGEARTATVV